MLPFARNILLSGLGGIGLGLAMVQMDKFVIRRMISEQQSERGE